MSPNGGARGRQGTLAPPATLYPVGVNTSPVTVKLFAALRDAADTASVEVSSPTTVGQIRRDLSARFGPRFAERLDMAAVMVDGVPVDADSEAPVPPGAEVALLPPFAGG